MSEQYFHLEQFLGCYFHQDWLMEAESGDEVLRRYADQESDAVRSAIAGEIADLLCAPDESVDEAVRHLGSYYDPSVEGLSTRQWLHKVKTVLQPK